MKNTLACREACSELSLSSSRHKSGQGGADGTGVVIQEGVWVGGTGQIKERRKQRVGVQGAEMQTAFSSVHERI